MDVHHYDCTLRLRDREVLTHCSATAPPTVEQVLHGMAYDAAVYRARLTTLPISAENDDVMALLESQRDKLVALVGDDGLEELIEIFAKQEERKDARRH